MIWTTSCSSDSYPAQLLLHVCTLSCWSSFIPLSPAQLHTQEIHSSSVQQKIFFCRNAAKLISHFRIEIYIYECKVFDNTG